MASLPIEVGDKLHVVSRRAFADDVHSHFVGEVSAVAGATMRITGFAFVFDSGSSSYIKHLQERTRILSLANAGYVVTLLPGEVDISDLSYRVIAGQLSITDGSSFSMQINEFGQFN